MYITGKYPHGVLSVLAHPPVVSEFERGDVIELSLERGDVALDPLERGDRVVVSLERGGVPWSVKPNAVKDTFRCHTCCTVGNLCIYAIYVYKHCILPEV